LGHGIRAFTYVGCGDIGLDLQSQTTMGI